jgi:hypothetical protein
LQDWLHSLRARYLGSEMNESVTVFSSVQGPVGIVA